MPQLTTKSGNRTSSAGIDLSWPWSTPEWKAAADAGAVAMAELERLLAPRSPASRPDRQSA